MNFIADLEFWRGLWKVIVADIILAGDNAVVIALAVRRLPMKQQFWGRIFGAFGAVALRVLFVWIISSLLKVPFLKFAGGVTLIWIAVKLVWQKDDDSADDKVHQSTSLFGAIGIIIVADVVMSFDNVMAIAGVAKGNMMLVILGLVFSIPLVVLGSGLLSSLMTRLPWLVWLGAGLLGHVAGHMMLEDERMRELLAETIPHLERWLPISLFVTVTGIGWWIARGLRSAKPAGGSVE